VDAAVRERAIRFGLPTALPSVQLPQHSVIDTEFVPDANQEQYATVFSNEAAAGSGQGIQFQNIGGDNYRLGVGLGDGQWALSSPIVLPPGKPAAISIELNTSTVNIISNGRKVQELHLPHQIVNSPGEITVGSWIGRERPFKGVIKSFQIRDLGASNNGLMERLPAGGHAGRR
jgi:hypothetical protein